MQVVEAQVTDVAEGIGDVHHQVAVLAQQRHQIGDGKLPPIHLTVLKRCGGGGRVGHHDPFDAIEQHPLAAREP